MVLRLLKESVLFAVHSLAANRLRTSLSLLGITIGIFSIISVYTVVDSFEITVRKELESLGDDLLYIQKWSWGGGGDYPWWKYLSRPEPTYREYTELKRRSTTIGQSAFIYAMTKTVKYRNNSVEGTEVQAVTHSLAELWNLELGEGRFFNEKEAESGLALAVLGSDVAEGLFDGGVALGKKITLMGRKVQVVGVIQKQGSSVFGNDFDQKVLVPANFVRKLIGQADMDGAAIMVKPKPGIELPRMKDEVRGIMRSLRRLKPKAEDNFALNENSMVSGGLDAIFSIIGIAGTVIGGFSILVGGFGIANIMFVSVRERTNQIGIQKAVGAKRWFLLTQFLAEAVVLSVIGGMIGIALVGLAVLISKATSFDLYLTVGNVVTGVLISVFIGLISGLLPAIQASRLDPVEAIRQGI